MEFKLGSEAKDSITGLRGILTARIEYVTGCIQYELTPTKLKDGAPQNNYWIDVGRVVVLKVPVAVKPATKKPGGSQSHSKP